MTMVLGLLFMAGPVRAQTPKDRAEPDLPERIFRSLSHYIVDNERVAYTLNEKPLPFVDWALVQPGFVEYLNRATGEIVPLNDAHQLQSPAEIQPAAFAMPSGLKLRTQPARMGGTLSEELLPADPRYPWEREKAEVHTLIFDEADKLYNLWYQADGGLAFATSKDMKHWDRPLYPHKAHGTQKATNLLEVINLDAAVKEGALKSAEEAKLGYAGSFFVDPSASADERYKTTFLARVKGGNEAYGREANLPVSAMTGAGSTVIFGAVSADGVGWRVLPKPLMMHDADTTTVVKWDTIQKQYVMFTRFWEFSRRTVARSESKDFRAWPLPQNVVAPGSQEEPTEDFYATGFSFYPGLPQLRTLFVLNYDHASDGSCIRLSMSRDGRLFHFTPGGPLITHESFGLSKGSFLSVVPSFVQAPDGRMLCFSIASTNTHKFPRYGFRGGSRQRLAWWPADRLVALEAESYGEFTTPSLKLDGNELRLNMAAGPAGGIQIELRDEKFHPIPGHTFAEADTLSGDDVSMRATWKGDASLSSLRGQKIYLRFRMRVAQLFAIGAH